MRSFLHRFFRQVFTGFAVIAFAAVALPASAYHFQRPFTHLANGEDLRATLTSFAHGQSLKAEISPLVKGSVSGNFRSVTAERFLAAMEEAYEVRYYVLGSEIHFYHASETKKAFVPLPTGSVEGLIASLRNSGFLAEELPVRSHGDSGMITVSGPQAYIDQIQSAASHYAASQTEKIVMRVFPLKHAWAEDITVTSMDKTITVPGIATILRAMVIGGNIGGQTVTQEKATVEKLNGKGLSALGRDSASAGAQPVSPQAAGSPVNVGSVSIIADPRVNAVLVSDAVYRMPYYEKVIEDLDKPVDLVEIHAAIVDIDANNSTDIGVNLAGGVSRSNTTTTGAAGGNAPATSSELINTAGALLSTVYRHGSDFFMARIRLLEEQNQAQVLGRPSVLTVDNVQATLENTTTYYVKVEGNETVDLFKVEAGTVLRVTPHIIREDGKTSIKLAVNVQDDQDSGTTAAESGSALPPIKQTKINTQAVIEAGQSLLVGGYYYERYEKGSSGVPLLKDIPWIGNLFKSSARSGKRMERLILLTPRIVSPGEMNVPARADPQQMQMSSRESTYEMRRAEPEEPAP